MGLAKDLKVGTKRSHTAAENTKFVASFLRGVVDEDSYKTLMRDFYFVYSAIEEEMQRLEDDGFLSAINFQRVKQSRSNKERPTLLLRS